jgi:hypothetical protein
MQQYYNNRSRYWRERFDTLFRVLSEYEKGRLKTNFSIPLDKKGLRQLRNEMEITKKIFRLGHQLNVTGPFLPIFAAYVERSFLAPRPSANHDISGRPFSSLRDGTVFDEPPDPRLAKVMRFFIRLGDIRDRVPTDKDIDYFIYSYFGSDSFEGEYGFPDEPGGDLFYGIQGSFYNRRGQRKERHVRPRFVRQALLRNAPRFGMNIRNVQRRLTNRGTKYYGGALDRNSSRANGGGQGPGRDGTGTRIVVSNNRPRHRNAATYLRNKPAVKRNQNNNKSNKRIQWQVNTVSNMPRDIISFENISNGEKVVKYSWKTGGETHSRYFQPQSFREWARMSMTGAYNKPGSFSMFENPETRANVKRANINFVILKKKVNKRKTNAATKIQKVVRGTQARNKIRKNAQNALNKLTVVQKSVLRKKTEKQASAARASAARATTRRTLLANAASKRKRSPK